MVARHITAGKPLDFSFLKIQDVERKCPKDYFSLIAVTLNRTEEGGPSLGRRQKETSD